MPGKACLKLKGKERADCLAYRGKYANKGAANPVKGSLKKPAGGGGY